MLLGGSDRLLAPRPSRGARGGRRAQRQVLAAKKDSSPWSTGGPKRGAGGGGAGGGGGSGSSGGSGKGSKGSSTGGSSSPWKDTPSPRQGLPSKPAKAGSGGAGSRLGSRLAPPPEVTITDPVEVTLLDELTPSERAAEPKWDTFCSHMNGEWVGQYAAYTPWEGKPEPAWLDERGKYINVVYTRALEHRFKYTPQQPQQQLQQEEGQRQQGEAAAGQQGDAEVDVESEAAAVAPMDVLLRKLGRCTKMAALADLRLPPEAAGLGAAGLASSSGSDSEAAAAAAAEADLDVEALAFNSDGIVVFDGGNYSAGPEYIGQQQVKYVNDEALEGLEDDEEDDEEEEKAHSERAGSGVAASTSASAASGGDRAAGGKGSKAVKAAAAKAADDDGMDDYLDELFGPDEDAEDEEDEDGSSVLPTTTSVFEQCLVDWGNRTRMRVKMTLRIGQMENGEVDVEVLRILLFHEQWLGPASAERLSAPLADIKLLQRPCTDLPRMRPEQMQGAWNVFTVSATGIDEADPFTGEERVVWVYSSTEEQQLWDASAQPPGGDEGGCYWLPGGVVVSLRMVDNYVPADSAEAQGDGSSSSEDESASGGVGSRQERKGQEHAVSNGNGNGSGKAAGARDYPRGLCLGMLWSWREGSVSQVEREYDGYGYLREVRLGQAVKGGWSGGRM
ncbi:hypothetical protein CHLRE_16g684900v5 [Chlamydomonas reinhardtii]|uniref:Uncharacterized protein n=1 Tax=Chlamydomonas reinhardtii TaxID=3055 RepID=A0A2K3CUT5_CHLRE|nr:uncharacterized protein CHLRE_16g684900v5 [Chlamydomonas reinhardtii]PNW72040.1 hypothetical protein CHLRE_16g684900v5 [Chlamydomonas reinhardtii]